MPELVVTSATLDLKPSSEWSWPTPPGPPSISIPAPSAEQASAWKVGGLSAVLPRHLDANVAAPQPLTFDFPPGKGGTLRVKEIVVVETSLAKSLKQDGQGFLLKTTTGTFQATVVTPAMNGATVVGPAAEGTLSGTWSISDAGQDVVAAG